MTPLKFNGEGELMEAERWLEEISEMIETLGVEGDEVRIRVAALQFQGGAVHWWRSYRDTVNIHALTWDEFKEAFLERFFPSVIREMKVQEFMTLQQGSLSVQEYERKFVELARFALQYVPDEAAKARKFEWGLSPHIRRQIIGLRLSTYRE